ncbi:ROK family protein [Brevundimonas sp.]|uniref:ROK family protein n=1 Tax=Brevundimonas sp. TaxID=1871086 RepID=UPI003D111893
MTEAGKGDSPLIAGIELGGTKCVCVLGTGPEDIRAEARIKTTTPVETLDAIDAVMRRWQDKHGFQAVGVASFGPLQLDPASRDHGRIVSTPKPGWSGADVLGRARRWGRPVGFDTDVNAAAFAEGRWGAAQGLWSFAYVTVGTGIGVGAVVQGRSIRGLGHVEAGHLRVRRMPGSTFAGACPFHGDCVEGVASGPAIAARSGFPAEQLTRNDPAWDEVVHALAGLFHNMVLTQAPERILMGGGLGMGQGHLLPRIRLALVESLAGYAQGSQIAEGIDAFLTHPGLGHRAGPMGALALGLRAIEGMITDRPI